VVAWVTSAFEVAIDVVDVADAAACVILLIKE